MLVGGGDLDVERRSASRLRVEEDAAAMLGHDVVGDGQALAGTLADRFGGEEGIEDPVPDGLRDSGSGVGNGHLHPVAAADAAQASAVSAVGVVQQVKADQGKVKINHEAIPALGWPPMSMYFRVKDKAVLEGIAAGDKVNFELEKGAAGLEITRMEKAAK